MIGKLKMGESSKMELTHLKVVAASGSETGQTPRAKRGKTRYRPRFSPWIRPHDPRTRSRARENHFPVGCSKGFVGKWPDPASFAERSRQSQSE